MLQLLNTPNGKMMKTLLIIKYAVDVGAMFQLSMQVFTVAIVAQKCIKQMRRLANIDNNYVQLGGKRPCRGY